MKSVSSMGDSWLETDGVRSERTEAMSATRIERDPLGELPVPAEALYGVQTERARHNFAVSHLAPLAPFVDAVIWIKKAAALAQLPALLDALDRLARAFLTKGKAFDGILKSGRTHLQDATPIRLGQEFAAYGRTVERNRDRIAAAADALRDLGIGGSAVGTGLNVEPHYPRLMVQQLRALTGLELREGQDRVQLMQSLGDATAFSGVLRTYAVDLGKIASDLRLLASGPRTGLAEILLPAVQPGSSIMPGKVNPSIAEMVNMVCYQAIGNDVTIAAAAEAGQLELNVMMPVIAHNLLFTMLILTNASRIFAERCVEGIEADRAMCEHWLERSPAIVTALAPRIGYAAAAQLAKEAVARNLTVRQLVRDKGLLSDAELDRVLDLRAMTEPGVPGEPKQDTKGKKK